jgi:hypothetical protein
MPKAHHPGCLKLAGDCADAVSELVACPALSVLDVSENKFDGEDLLEVLAGLPELAVLYANNNPLCSKIVPVSIFTPLPVGVYSCICIVNTSICIMSAFV